MTSTGRERFGEFVRREREAKEIGLREMAKMIGVSPTYLSKVERDEFPPPAEDKVKEIAKIIGCDADELLARAGRVSSDLSDIIKRHPVELAALLRTTKGLTAEDIARLARAGAEGEGQVTADRRDGFDDADEDDDQMTKFSSLPRRGGDRARCGGAAGRICARARRRRSRRRSRSRTSSRST